MSTRIGKKEKKSYRMALCGILTALSVVFLMLVPVLPIMLYCAPVLSGLCAAIAAEEFGVRYSLGVYTASSVLSLLLAADKEAVLVYVLLSGLYPVIRLTVNGERYKVFKKTAPRIAVKLLLINAGLFAYYFSAVYLFGIPKDSFGSVWVRWMFLIVGNVIMLLYDRAIGNALLVYKHKLRPLIVK